MVWPCHKKPSKDNSTKNSERWAKARLTKERLACSIKEWTGLSFADSQEVAKSGCDFIDKCSNDHSVKGQVNR